jgi:hypothetical protein
MACARDPQSRDRDRDQDVQSRDRDVGQVVRDETETRPWVGLETISRPRLILNYANKTTKNVNNKKTLRVIYLVTVRSCNQ